MHAPTRAMRRAQNILCQNPSNPGLPTNREHSKQLVNYAPRAMRGIFYARVNHVPDYQLIADTTNGSSIMRHAPYAMRHARNILCASQSCPGLPTNRGHNKRLVNYAPCAIRHAPCAKYSMRESIMPRVMERYRSVSLCREISIYFGRNSLPINRQSSHGTEWRH